MMWLKLKLSLLFVILLQLSSISCEECSTEINCTSTPCLSYNRVQIFANLWKLPKKPLTPLVCKLRDEILRLMRKKPVNTSLSSILGGLSLWSVDRLTNFNPRLSPSCIYSRLIRETIAANRTNCKENLNKAIGAYNDLGQLAIINSLSVGLAAVGCPARIPPPRPSTLACPLNMNEIRESLRMSKNIIPKYLKKIIKRLVCSKNADEQLIGLAATAVSTESSIEVYKRISQLPIGVTVLQLKGCNVPVPKTCCTVREEVLKDYLNLLSIGTNTIFTQFIRENNN